MHGILRKQDTTSPPGARGGVRRIVIRYTDGRTVNVVPDAKRKTFSEDDAKELRKIFAKASATLEWADVSSRPTM